MLKINPPIFVRQGIGLIFALSSVEEIMSYLRRNEPDGDAWNALRKAVFVAAADWTPENAEAVRALAIEAFGDEIWASGSSGTE